MITVFEDINGIDLSTYWYNFEDIIIVFDKNKTKHNNKNKTLEYDHVMLQSYLCKNWLQFLKT